MTAIVQGFVDEISNENAHVIDENTSLLHVDVQLPRSHNVQSSTLPRKQLAALCAIRLADPIAFTQIFPYVNEMMTKFGVATDPAQVGFYSGLVESVFAISQFLSIYNWAKLSDKVGRKPVVLLGAIGIVVTTIQLGFSRTLTGVLFARVLAGLFSGNVAVMHSVLGELTDSSNQATAFPIFGLCWPVGIIIGPLLGGTFSNPAAQYPEWFGNTVFSAYPYLLPCLATAFLTFIGLLIGIFWLEETMPRRRHRTEKDLSISYGTNIHQDDLLGNGPPLTVKALLAIPVIRSLCTSGCALSFIGTAFDVVFVLFCYSPINEGGLAYSASEIGFALAIAGASSAAIQLFAMPHLLSHYSASKLYKICMGIWPYAFLFLPFLNILARSSINESAGQISEKMQMLIWIGIGLSLTMSRVACLAYSLNMILVKEHAPGLSALGAANGLAQSAQCLARAISPAFVSCLFAFSVDFDVMGGHLWVLVMFVLSVLSWILSGTLPDRSDTLSRMDNLAFIDHV